VLYLTKCRPINPHASPRGGEPDEAAVLRHATADLRELEIRLRAHEQALNCRERELDAREAALTDRERGRWTDQKQERQHDHEHEHGHDQGHSVPSHTPREEREHGRERAAAALGDGRGRSWAMQATPSPSPHAAHLPQSAAHTPRGGYGLVGGAEAGHGALSPPDSVYKRRPFINYSARTPSPYGGTAESRLGSGGGGSDGRGRTILLRESGLGLNPHEFASRPDRTPAHTPELRPEMQELRELRELREKLRGEAAAREVGGAQATSPAPPAQEAVGWALTPRVAHLVYGSRA
jgi:hypothetical protein